MDKSKKTKGFETTKLQEVANVIKTELMRASDEILKLYNPLPGESLEAYYDRLNDISRSTFEELKGDSIADAITQSIMIRATDYARRKKQRAIDSMPAAEILKLKAINK